MANPFNLSELGASPEADGWRSLMMMGANLAAAANARNGQGFLTYGNGFAGPLGAAVGATAGQVDAANKQRSLMAYQRAQTDLAGTNAEFQRSMINVLNNPPPAPTMDITGLGGMPPVAQGNGETPPPKVATGGGFAGPDFISGILSGEGTGQNPRGSARGIGQFTNDTFKSFIAAHQSVLGGLSPQQQEALRNNPEVMKYAVSWLTKQNAAALQANGLTPNGPNLGAAYFLGPTAAATVWRAPDNAPVAPLLVQSLGMKKASQYVQQNPELGSMTAGDIRKKYARLPDPDFIPKAGPQGAGTQVAGGPQLPQMATQTASAQPTQGMPQSAFGNQRPTVPLDTPPGPDGVSRPVQTVNPQQSPMAFLGATSVVNDGTQPQPVPLTVPPPQPPPPQGGFNMSPQQALAQAQKFQQYADYWNRFPQLAHLGAPYAKLADQLYGIAMAGPRAAAEESAKLPFVGPRVSAEESAKLPYVGPAAAARSAAELPYKLAEQGFTIDANGNARPIPGSKADPLYVGELEAAKAQAQADAAIREAWAKPLEVRQGGAVFDKRTGQWVAQNPHPVTVTDQSGAQRLIFPTPLTPGAQPNVVGGDGIQTSPGVGQTEALKIAAHAQEKDINEDRDKVSSATDSLAKNTIPAKMQLLQARELLGQTQSGSGGEWRADFRNWVQTYMPTVADKLDINAAPAQEFKKLVTMQAGTQERQTLGARGGFQAMQLFLNANPSLNMQPEANKFMMNALLISHQYNQDYTEGLNSFYQRSREGFNPATGDTKYQPTTKFDQEFAQKFTPHLYKAAIDAMNGKPADEWRKGLSPAQMKIVGGIIARADPNAFFLDENGKKIYGREIGSLYSPTDVGNPSANGKTP